MFAFGLRIRVGTRDACQQINLEDTERLTAEHRPRLKTRREKSVAVHKINNANSVLDPVPCDKVWGFPMLKPSTDDILAPKATQAARVLMLDPHSWCNIYNFNVVGP